MLSWLLRRCLWIVPMLLGITFLTFLVLDLAPVDRAKLQLLHQETAQSQQTRDEALLRLRLRYGLLERDAQDPTVVREVPVWRRYWRWLVGAATFQLAGPHEDQQAFRLRLGAALPVTLMLGFWALVAAFGLGVPLGAWLGQRTGSRADRIASALLFVAIGLPEILVATLLMLGFGGVWLHWFPTGGLGSEGAQDWSTSARMLDLAWHLVLPVATLALAPFLLIVRFLRESVARAGQAPFATNLRAWGAQPSWLRARLLTNGCAPLATLCGSLVPMLVGGSIVVETVFSLDGVGRLAWDAVRSQDHAMVMALTLLTSVVSLLALVLSDLLHRLIDPRVRLGT